MNEQGFISQSFCKTKTEAIKTADISHFYRVLNRYPEIRDDSTHLLVSLFETADLLCEGNEHHQEAIQR
jgi:hypothetical protein